MTKSVPPMALPDADRVRLVAEGLEIGHELVPLRAAAVDYFQVEPEAWRDVLGAVRALGFRLVELRVPWNVHELERDEYDFDSPRLNLRGFLLEAARFGLYAIVRIGPRLDESSDLAFDGLPRRVAWDPECHAVTCQGNPLVIPRLLHSFPEPSWSSRKYLGEVEGWYAALAQVLRRLVFPHGPVVLIEVDSEHAAQLPARSLGDFHPNALSAYRDALRDRYGKLSELRQAHGTQIVDFHETLPPRAVLGLSDQTATAHLDWTVFQRQLAAQAYSELRSNLIAQGLEGAAWILPQLGPFGGWSIADTEALVQVQTLRGDADWKWPERALLSRAQALGIPSFVRLRSGYSLDESPLSGEEHAYQSWLALARGARGFTVTPAVPRPYALGAVLEADGAPTEFTEHWAKLLEVVETCQAHLFRPEASVTLVVPARVALLSCSAQALKPWDAAWLGLPDAALGAESTLGAPFEPELAQLLEAQRFFQELIDALRSLRVPYQICADEHLDHALSSASWTVAITTRVLEPSLAEGLRFAQARGAAVSIGPFWPSELGAEPDSASGWPRLLPSGRAELRAAVSALVRLAGLRQLRADPPEVEVVFHSAPTPGPTALLYVINPTPNSQSVSVECPGYDAIDVLNGEQVQSFAERLALTVSARTVRVLELRSVL
ncbi:MAG: hypothetical protein RJA70_87 [Pseudomonadota bacterium]|jgi:beta-galactosidase